MNNNYFKCAVRYDKTMETGLLKKVTENYLLEALSYTEAERRFIEEMTPFVSGEFEVSKIQRMHLAELFLSQDAAADRFYIAKIAYITLDEHTGAEKRTPCRIMIQAKDFEDAKRQLDKGMEGTLGDWVILSIAETNIMDYFRYEQEQQPEA